MTVNIAPAPVEGGAEGDATSEGAPADGGTQSTYTPPASQDELNRIVETRLARERAKYADYDDMKARLADIEEQGKSEMQKAVEAAKAEGASEARSALEKQIVSTSIKAAAAAAGFIDPADAVAYLASAEIAVGDDGADAAAIQAALDDLAKTKPYLVAADPSGRVARGPSVRKGAQQEGAPKQMKAHDALRQLGKQRGR